MDAGFESEKEGKLFPKSCSKLLELAAMDDLVGFINEVEERGCDVDEVSYWYGRSFGSNKMRCEERTPILIASLYGSIQVLEYIIGTGKVDVNRPLGSDRATPLHCAAAGGSLSSADAVKLLMTAGSDNTVVDVNGKKPGDLIAPCVKSCSNGNKRVVEMMLNGVMIEDEEGSRTPQLAQKKEYPTDVSLPGINDGVYGTDEFRMYSFKVTPCSRAYSHDWTECPFAHPGENARRRDPRKYHYTCVPCPEFKKGSCAKGDACEYAHGIFESWMHPAQYRTRLCKDEIGCSRKVCFFAHRREDLRPVYASTGSGMPSPKTVSGYSLDLSTLSPLSLGSPSIVGANTSTPPMSPSVTCSSPLSGNLWQSKANLMPPPLQLPSSRLKTSLNARNVELDIELEKVWTRQRQQMMVEEMAGLSSPYNRIGDLNPTNLDDVFGSIDPLSQYQGMSPKMQSPTALKTRQNMNQLRSSYPTNMSSSPSGKPCGYGLESSAAVAAAVMNSRSSAFARRSQSFIDRADPGVGNWSGVSSSMVGINSPSPISSKFSKWNSPDGKLDWGFSGEEANKLRKSPSFGRNGAASNVCEPDVSWVHSLVKDVPSGAEAEQRLGVPYDGTLHWLDQVYIDNEQQIMA